MGFHDAPGHVKRGIRGENGDAQRGQDEPDVITPN